LNDKSDETVGENGLTKMDDVEADRRLYEELKWLSLEIQRNDNLYYNYMIQFQTMSTMRSVSVKLRFAKPVQTCSSDGSVKAGLVSRLRDMAVV